MGGWNNMHLKPWIVHCTWLMDYIPSNTLILFINKGWHWMELWNEVFTLSQCQSSVSPVSNRYQTDRQTELLFRFVQSTSSKHINNNINCHAIKRFTTLLNWQGKNKYLCIINNGDEHTRFSAQYIQHQNAFVMHV